MKRTAGLVSALKTMAVPSSRYLRRFSAKLSSAPGNQLVPGNTFRSSTTFSYFLDALMSRKSQTAAQKSGMFVTDHS